MMNTARYARSVREDVLDSLKLYAESGCPTGGFLEAVLSNDLARAMGQADSSNRAGLFYIVDFVYNEMPSDSWGTPDKVAAWINAGGLRGHGIEV